MVYFCAKKTLWIVLRGRNIELAHYIRCVLREDCKDSRTIHLIERSLYLALKVQLRVVHRQAG